MNLNKITVYSVLFFTSLFPAVNDAGAAELIDPGRILATAVTDYRLESLRELDTFARKMPRSTPYVDKMEFRTQTDEFDPEKQEYSLRIYPKGWGETRCGKNLAQTKVQAGRISFTKQLHAVIKERYDLIIDYLEAKTMIAHEQSLLANYEDQIRVLKKLSQSDLAFDINELINVQDQRMAHRLKQIKLENGLSALNHQIILLTGCDADFSLDTNNLIRIPDVEKNLHDFPGDLKVDNPGLRDLRNKIALAEQKYNLEVAENRDFLTYFEVGYDMDDRDDPVKAYTVELALRLPFIHRNRDDIYRRKVNWMEEKLEYREAEAAMSEKLMSLKLTIQRFVDQYHILTRRQTDSEAAATFDVYRHMDGSNPLVMLKIRESMIRNDIQTEETRYEILRRYVDLLDLNGVLGAEPLLNCISTNREPVR